MTKKAAEDAAPPAESALPATLSPGFRTAPVADDPLAGLQPGRVVHYHPRDYEARHCAPGPWAAIVSAVGALPGQATLHILMPVPAPVGLDPVARYLDVPWAGKPPLKVADADGKETEIDPAWKEGKWTFPERV